jgi:hypothetical protein
VPVTDVGLVVVLVEAEVLAGVSGQALAGAEDTGEVLAGEELTRPWEDGSMCV